MKICFIVCIIISGFDLCYTSCGNERSKFIINTRIHFDIPNLLKNNASLESLVKAQTSRLLLNTELYFLRPSLNLPIQFRIVESRVVWSVAHLKNEKVSDSDLLSYYCSWQNIQKQARNDTWWFSILVTDANLYDTRISSIIAGRAVLRQFCSASLSCLIIRYTPKILELANTLAHELAHGFGVEHDDIPDTSFIMSSNLDPNKPLPNTWSPASRAGAERFIKSYDGRCFGDYALRVKILDDNK